MEFSKKNRIAPPKFTTQISPTHRFHYIHMHMHCQVKKGVFVNSCALLLLILADNNRREAEQQ